MTSIPWNTQGSPHAERVQAEISELSTLYNSSVTCKIATNAIVEEILRSRPRYLSVKTGEVNMDMPVPHSITDLVRECIASVLQVGYFSYRFLEGTGMQLPLVIGHPLETYPSLGEDGVALSVQSSLTGETGAKRRVPKWDAVFFNRPIFARGSKRVLHSRLYDAREAIENMKLLRANHLRRDTFNSSHAGFATVNPALSSMGNETWFSGRDGAADSAVRPFLSRDIDFNQIVKNRAKTIRQLGDQTRILRAQNPEPINAKGKASVEGQRDHEEHVVTDGYNFHEARALQSLGNASTHYDRLETAAFFALGVPPQALGKNINSERLASANTLTQSALRMFASFCRRFQRALSRVFQACSEVDGHYIGFSQTVKDNDVSELAPFLKTRRLLELTATVYGIPATWIDTERLATHQEVLLGGKGGGGRKAGQEVPPERKSDAERSSATLSATDARSKRKADSEGAQGQFKKKKSEAGQRKK